MTLKCRPKKMRDINLGYLKPRSDCVITDMILAARYSQLLVNFGRTQQAQGHPKRLKLGICLIRRSGWSGPVYLIKNRLELFPSISCLSITVK